MPKPDLHRLRARVRNESRPSHGGSGKELLLVFAVVALLLILALG